MYVTIFTVNYTVVAERAGGNPLLSIVTTFVTRKGEYMNMMKELQALLEPTVQAQGCELYDLEYVKEGGERILRLFIDTETGVALNDCERVSRAVELVLDENDPIQGNYRLQVGSPGVERKLTKPEHFKRYVGSKIQVRLYSPHTTDDAVVMGRKKFKGVLTAFEDNKITITDDDGQSYTFAPDQVSACNLVVFES